MSCELNLMPMSRMPAQNQGQMPVNPNMATPNPGYSPYAFPVTPGPSGTPVPATGSTLGGTPIMAPSMLENPAYIPGFLRTQVGKKVRIEFLIGTGTTTDRVGTLIGVGSSYVLLRLEESDDVLMADLYAIKFVTFYQ